MALRMTPEEYFALQEDRNAIPTYIPQPTPTPKKEVPKTAPPIRSRIIYVQKEDPLMKIAIGAILFILFLILVVELAKLGAMLRGAQQ